MQTPRDISYTGNPTGGTTAYPAVLPAAHEATENSDNIFYRTIRTVMKKQLIYLLASAGLLAAGCSTENAPETTGYGTLSVSCTADTSIDTASAEASGTPEAPAAGAFSLTVTGETGTQKWDTLTEFEQSETVFRMGSYTVAIAHGDPDAEGAGKPYYYAEQKIEVLPRRTVNADLTATVANSQVVIRATEQFLAYFHDARFTVTTASGNEFAFTPGSDPADEPVFVKGGTRLTVTGTARRQSPTGTGEGPEVTFSAQTLDSETLRPLLPVINLPEKFDICDIPDELVEVLHGEFGFPINEQVKNRTSVTFSITKFVEILLEIPGEHNFVLDVTDNDNVLTHKTVKLIVH